MLKGKSIMSYRQLNTTSTWHWYVASRFARIAPILIVAVIVTHRAAVK
jgi:hypothetical protein